MNNKGADQTAPMRRLIDVFIVRIWHKQVFSLCGSYFCNYAKTTLFDLQQFSWIFYDFYCIYMVNVIDMKDTLLFEDDVGMMHVAYKTILHKNLWNISVEYCFHPCNP